MVEEYVSNPWREAIEVNFSRHGKVFGAVPYVSNPWREAIEVVKIAFN